MRKISLLFIALTAFLYGNARIVVFKTTENIPISNVRCMGLNAKMDSIATWVSNNNGEVDINNSEVANILASHPDFSERLVALANLKSNNVILSSSKSLDEVTVTPDDVKEFDNYTSYRISLNDMARYPNVLQSLNEIPNMMVLSTGAIFYEGNQNIKVLLNGVETSQQELKTISKEDISKVDVYRNPPARYVAQGIAAVIDIRLKSKIHGGNGGFDIDQAFYTLKGDNSAALYYNYKQSRFSLLYSNENTHYNRYSLSEELDYTFDGKRYNKTKEGLDSKSHYDFNKINLTYQINKPKNFLYHIRGSVGFNRDSQNMKQRVNENITGQENTFFATNYLKTKYTNYVIGNYGEKTFGNGSVFRGNVNYIHYSTAYNSRYQELGGTSPELQDSHSEYSTRLNKVFYEFQYDFPKSALGYFGLVAFGNYSRSEYANIEDNSFYQSNSTVGGLVSWYGFKHNISWYARMGVNWYNTSSSQLEKANKMLIPAPAVTLTWFLPIPSTRVMLSYSYSGSIPSIAQLSETNQWLDNKLVYHGNSLLKPYKSHELQLRFVHNNKYLNLSLSGWFISSPGMICDMYSLRDNYMLQTFVNLDTYREFGGQLTFTIKPLGNNLLEFWNRLILAKLKGKNEEYSWNGPRFQWMSVLSLNLTHWTVSLFYQYPGKVASGQLIMPRTQMWSAEVLYRPHTNLSLGVKWMMPFGKGLKEKEYTVDSAPVYSNREIFIKDWANQIFFKLSYNFSFGRNKNSVRPAYDNGNSDSGILKK